MTSFKRWFGAGAIVVVALALVACPAMVPKPTGQIPDMTFDHGAKATTVTDLGRFFDEDQNAKYGAASSDSAVATATVADTTLTVTPGAAGTATVTVTATASNGRDTAEQNFKVTVRPAPKPPDPPTNSAPTLKTLKDVPSLAVGGVKAVDLSAYAADADGDTLSYTAVSSDSAIAEATVSGSTATIAGAAAGTATITVTVTDDNSDPVSGTFKVTVTATPPDNRAPVLLTSKLIEHVKAPDFRVGMTKTYTLSDLFQDPDADDLEYEAMPSDTSVATVTTPDAAGMFTLTAVGVGQASITVKATDPDGAWALQTFNVGVGSKAPMANSASTNVRLVLKEGMKSQTLDLDDYFDDDLDEDLTYVLVSNDSKMYATAAVVGSKLTITAVAEGSATVTVSAKDSDNDPVELAFNVMVTAKPLPPNNRPMVKPGVLAPVVEIVVEGQPETLMLSMYFMDEDADDTLTYTVTPSSHPLIATASESKGVLTIMPKGAGTATIKVTASDGEAMSAALEISVTVRAAGNLTPSVKGDGPPDLKMVVNGKRPVDFSEHFEDTDSPQLFYSVKADNADVIEFDPVLDGTNFETKVEIKAKAVGKATVTVTATDFGNKFATDTFTVTVIASGDNADPEAVKDAVIVDVDGIPATTRLTVGGDKTVIDGKIKGYFDDANFVASGKVGSRESGETLTFEVEYFEKSFTEGNKTDTQLVAAAKNPFAADAITVSADVSPKTWNGDINSTFTLTLTALKEASTSFDKPDEVEAHAVALIATDEYGRRAAQVFHVRVNHKPKAGGKEGTLSALKKYYDPPMQVHDNPKALENKVTLKDYFSDGDGVGDIMSCRRTGAPATDSVATIEWTDATTFTIVPKADGTMRVTVDCLDAANERSEPDTLRITVEGRTFSQR